VISSSPLSSSTPNSMTIQRSNDRSRIVQEKDEDKENEVRPGLVRLIPFNLQMALLDGSDVNIDEVTAIVTNWMTESFATKSTSEGLLNEDTYFTSIALELVDQYVQTQTTAGGDELSLFTASMEGVSLWEIVGSDAPNMDPEIVELVQRATFLDDNTLLQSLQTANDVVGLGDNVVDIRVFVVDEVDTSNSEDGSSGSEETTTSTNDSLEIIIIIAIAVACLAFALLVFAVVWAWRSDRKSRPGPNGAATAASGGGRRSTNNNNNKASSRTKNKEQSPKLNTDGTGSESDFGDTMANGNGNAAVAVSAKNSNYITSNNNKKNQQRGTTSYKEAAAATSYNKNNHTTAAAVPKEKSTPMDIDSDIDHDYPDDSIISEDISTSLTAYYKSGMSGYNVSNAVRASQQDRRDSAGGHFNDAASMSSMDSYGYSLDGYAPSLGPTQGGYPVGPLRAARDAPMNVGDDDDDDADIEEPEDYETEPHTTL
jgi:cytoskeletal protein RodZ